MKLSRPVQDGTYTPLLMWMTKNHDEIGSKSAMSEILNIMHGNTFKDHKVDIEEPDNYS